MRTPQLLKIKKDKSHKYNTKQKKQTQNSIILYDLPYTKFKTRQNFYFERCQNNGFFGKRGWIRQLGQCKRRSSEILVSICLTG